MIALLLALATAVFAALATLVLAAKVAAPRGTGTRELLSVYPELVRLLVNLSKDRQVARPVRWRLLFALVYNVQPINVIPNFIPVIGLADNIAVTAWALRGAIRGSGPQVVAANWRGSEAGLVLVYRLCRLKAPPENGCHEGPERSVKTVSPVQHGR